MNAKYANIQRVRSVPRALFINLVGVLGGTEAGFCRSALRDRRRRVHYIGRASRDRRARLFVHDAVHHPRRRCR
jgi:hypothetical protein